MKLFIMFFLLGTSSLFAIEVNSQTMKVSIHHNNSKISEILNDIENQSDYLFFYNHKEIKSDTKASINVEDKTVSYVLDKLFKDTDVKYSMLNNHIVLSTNISINTVIKNGEKQQSKEITGTVKDENSEPLAGVTVLVKGTTSGTVTDENGKFMIRVQNNQSITLIFSLLGFIVQEVKVGDKTEVHVMMQEDQKLLDEVIVVGYGTQKRSDLIGSVASVSQKDLGGRATLTVQDALQGKVPGVMVSQNNGQPGSTPTVRIRGIGTLNNNDPLYIVDGVPISNGADIINNKDIESIEILKDAASASIYGSRAGNGVIIITTKKGMSGKPTVFYDGNIGYHEASKQLDLLNAKDFAMISDEALVNGGKDPYWKGSTGRADTDWQSKIFRKGLIHSHSVGVRGGKQDIRYYLAAGYDDQQGTLRETNYNRYSIKSNLDVNVSKRLIVGMNLSYLYSTSLDIEQGANSVLMNAVRMPATVPAYNEDGTLGYPVGNEGDGQNPIGYAKRSKSRSNSARGLVNIYAKYEFFKGLLLHSNFSADIWNGDYSRFSPTFNEGNAKNQIASLSESYSKNKNITFENTLSYNKTLDKAHQISALIGQSIITFDEKSTSASKKGFISNDENMRYFNAGTEQDQVSGSRGDWALLSYFGRVNYNFDNRYLFQFNVRTDGSSRFGPNNKWGVFPSVALGWRLSEEKFLKNTNWLSNLKLRASYGALGTMPSSYYGFTSSLNQSKYILGTSQNVVIGYHPGSTNNDDFKWETTYQTNAGVDVGLWDNKLSFTIEYFNKYTKDILQTLPIPGIAGTGSSLTNIGEMRNRGVEVTVNYTNQINGFNYYISGNIATLNNKIMKLFDNDAPISSGNCRTEVGRSIGEFYGYVTDGLFQNQAEIDAYKLQPLAKPGDVRFKDTDGNGKLDAEDMDFLGSPIPSVTYSLNLGCDYKNIDLSLSLLGVGGNKIYYSGRSYLINGGNTFNKSTEILNRWQKEGDKTSIPRVSVTNANDNFRRSDLFIEDGSYLRLGNIQLGYSVSSQWLNKIGFQTMRMYISANNLVTFTKYKGYDPEISISNALNGGNDQITYPVPRTVLFGLSFTL
ncbi:TonB-dependent receptor [Dysgonomonas sp. Marseille-P4677]|uniref:TonB-dependent receptor n=1 Tax=Dysgonomonas sp. Marseille-P4677 TaxID=2364790 RepID=UPI001911B314|nr:TonB-dependent receptor [Dysgonomonas sp. Marseille-P4677]MBK5721878.1 TonB-dependent receptor [Dysgonomonas sp. Marseille-P4677]